MSVTGEGSIRAGRAFCTVARAVSEEPYIPFFSPTISFWICHAGSGRNRMMVFFFLYKSVDTNSVVAAESNIQMDGISKYPSSRHVSIICHVRQGEDHKNKGN